MPMSACLNVLIVLCVYWQVEGTFLYFGLVFMKLKICLPAGFGDKAKIVRLTDDYECESQEQWKTFKQELLNYLMLLEYEDKVPEGNFVKLEANDGWYHWIFQHTERHTSQQLPWNGCISIQGFR